MTFILHCQIVSIFLLLIIASSELKTEVPPKTGNEIASENLTSQAQINKTVYTYKQLRYSKTSQDRWKYSYETCVNLTIPTNEVLLGEFLEQNVTLKEFIFDDKCYYHCIYTFLEVISAKDPGKIIKNVGGIVLQRKMNSDVQKQTNEVWNECVDDSEKTMNDSQRWNEGKKKPPCLLYTLHMFCVMKRLKERKIF